jgi:hypothetical protein
VRPGRRAAIGSLLAAAACGRAPETPPPPATPPSYSHLLPLRFAVARIEILPPRDPAALRVMPPAPLLPADVVRIMAEDRLVAAGGNGVARFTTQTATLTREPSSGGGLFGTATERLSCVMRCRLEIIGADGDRLGFAEAEVRRSAIREAGSIAQRARAAEEIVRAAGDALNVEFEFQVRRNLRALLAPEPPAPPAEGATPAAEDAPASTSAPASTTAI